MAEVTITVCDICKNPVRPTREYRVESEGRIRVVQLCHIDGGDLERFLEGVNPVRRKRKAKIEVTTLEEIEEIKRREREGKAPSSD